MWIAFVVPPAVLLLALLLQWLEAEVLAGLDLPDPHDRADLVTRGAAGRAAQLSSVPDQPPDPPVRAGDGHPGRTTQATA